MYFRTLIFLIVSLVTQQLFADKINDGADFSKIQKLENKVMSCSLIDPNPFSEKVLNCYKNGHNLIKNQINMQLKKLNTKDQSFVLNNKGLNFEIQKYNCGNIYSSHLLVKECQVYADISYLNYIYARFN